MYMKSIKIFICSCMLVVLTIPIHAQTFSEWFSQKKTQKKYLLEQIAALQMYIGYAKKGYEIAGGGLNTIRNITNGEFKLHDLFITGSKKVSPVVKNDVRVAEIILLEIEIIKSFASLVQQDVFNDNRMEYLLSVKGAVMQECLSDLEELLLVITSGKVEMTDDERIRRLNGIYGRMKDKAGFTQDFTNQVIVLHNQLQTEKQTVDKLRRYYEIN